MVADTLSSDYNYTAFPWQSDDLMELALALSDRQIQLVSQTDELGGPEVARRLRALRQVVWGDGKSPPTQDKQEKTAAFQNALQGLDEKKREQLFSSYARMGNLYDIAALTARDNYFKQLKDRNGMPEGPPGGPADVVRDNRALSSAQLVEKFNKPVFEVVMTQHPTNVNSLDSMESQRLIIKALGATGEDRENDLLQALAAYQHTPVLHEVDGKDTNLTVRDETENVITSLGNIYEDMPRVYKQYDDALRKHGQDEYKPETLQLGIRLGSWGSSGDKDGNSQVTAETTLEAMALHTKAIVSHYQEELAGIQPPVGQWQRIFEDAGGQLKPLMGEIEQLRKDSVTLRQQKTRNPDAAKELNERFDALSARLAQVRSTVDIKQFEGDVLAHYQAHKDQPALDLLRRIRIFGLNFSKIEYRETAAEYSRVVAALVPGYETLTPAQRAEKLTELLNGEGNQPAELFKQMEQTIIAQGADKKYDKKDALPIAYHTLKRMQLARDLPDMVKDNVLAECGKLDKKNPGAAETAAQGLSNLLEAQFLQRAAAQGEKRPLLGIVPLFEEPETMSHVDTILEAAYTNPAYMRHLHDLHGDNPLQEVEFAHSDNARRSGMEAARADIHEGHDKVLLVNKKYNIRTRFFQGGSASDAYRNGVRSISATVNAFGLYDFAKFTFQGGDLLNYFNHPASSERLFGRNISHQAGHLEKNEQGEWNVVHKTARNGQNGNSRKPNKLMDRIAIRALQRTLHDYQSIDFQAYGMGVVLAALGYNDEIAASNVASRKGARVEDTDTLEDIRKKLDITPIDIDIVRTIGFSEAWQHNGLVPSWIGSQNLPKYLYQETLAELANIRAKTVMTDDEGEFVKLFGNLTANDRSLNASQFNLYYQKSPTFYDAQDRSAFALALTDMDAAKAIIGKKLEEREDDTPEQKQLKYSGRAYLEVLESTYRTAARVAKAAMKGELFDSMYMDGDMIRHNMADMLPAKDDILRKSAYRDFLLHTKVTENGRLTKREQKLVHASGDTVMHSRWPMLEDPAFYKRRMADKSAEIGLAM